MPKPWGTCIDRMELPFDEQPRPPREVKPKPAPKAPARKSTRSATAPRSKRPAKPAAGRLPRSVTDPLPDLIGEHDLAYEIPPDDLGSYISGSEADWLPVSTMLSGLRSAGYVDLQIDEELVARARVKGIGYRERRWDPVASSDLGPGATIEVDGWGWSRSTSAPRAPNPCPASAMSRPRQTARYEWPRRDLSRWCG